jgi:hypothetical protein
MYTEGIGNIGVSVVFQDDTVWTTQKNMAEIFDTSRENVTMHLQNIFSDGELIKESVCKEYLHTASDGKNYNSIHYNLDAIISVGYRVNSQKATQFRIWATGIIKQYIKDGYVINDSLLRKDPEKLNKLAAKIRELRAGEKNIYASVRECFKLSASDYDPSSKEVKSFYTLLQDKFHHAVTKMTASKLIIDRADSTINNMGLVSFKDLIPTKDEAKIGKNYLTEEELYRMHLLSEQFLLFAESSALMGKRLTMKQLHNQLDTLLTLSGYPVFDGYKDFLRDEAIKHAESEHENYINYKKLEMLGVIVDYVDYLIGEYEDYREQMKQISFSKLCEHFKEKQQIATHRAINLNKSLSV